MPGAITPALCWAHARRQFFELVDIAANARRGGNAAAISPVALEAVRRIDVLFDIERGINGLATATFDGFQQYLNTGVNALPIPASLPLFASVLALMGLLGWHMKRKASAGLAAA
jgi:hypothetical protein